MNNLKKYLLLSILVAQSLTSYGNPQNPFTGETVICGVPATETYTYNLAGSGFNWSATLGGTIISGNGTSTVVVEWTTDGAKQLSVDIGNPTLEELSVAVNGAGTLSGTGLMSCSGSANVNLTYAPPSNPTGSSWEWQSSEPGGPWIPLNSEPTGIITETTSFRYVASGGACGDMATNVVTYKVIKIPTGIEGVIHDVYACDGADVTMEILGHGASLIEWQKRVNLAGGGTPVWEVIPDTNPTDNLIQIDNFVWAPTDVKAILDYQGCVVNSELGKIINVPNTTLKEVKGARKVLENDNEGLVIYKSTYDEVENWESSIDGTNWTTILSEQGISISYKDLLEDTEYRAKVMAGEGCNVLTTSSVTVTVIETSLNTVETKGFSVNSDGSEKLISHSKAYFDYVGKVLQTQTKNLAADQVLAAQTIDDEEGRPLLSSLPAPINHNDFLYRSDFVTTATGEVYDHTNFDGIKTESPDPVGNSTVGTLGWYYSDNNSFESRVATTSYPYSRTDYYEDGSGEVKRSAQPGDALRMGMGHEVAAKTLPVGNGELPYYTALRELIVGPGSGDELERVYKEISIDPNGKEAVVYIGESGDPIANALSISGNALPVTLNTSMVDESGILVSVPTEFHIPAGSSITVDNEGASEGQIYNKYTEEETSLATLVSSTQLGPGIYKIDGTTQISYDLNYSDHSYSFYDNAGRLVASIAPKGVEAIFASGTVPLLKSGLTYTTFYTYDFQGRLLQMEEADAGIAKYVYRKDGSIRFSQNAEQMDATPQRYSYTSYDYSGRPIESGEYNGTGSMDFQSTAMEAALESIGVDFTTAQTTDWVKTSYDLPDSRIASIAELTGYSQNYLDGAVSYTENENVITWYSYDEFGRVTWLAMQYKGLNDEIFTLDYTYDFTGNVTEVAFLKNVVQEAFYHHYTYDAENRLTAVYTSLNGVFNIDTNGTPTTDDTYLHARYYYYLHGPLKRVEYANDLQGIDYTYTAQGWLKSINNPIDPTDNNDSAGALTSNKDAFGMSLDYYLNDYQRANSGIASLSVQTSFADQFGGNIKAQHWGRNFLSSVRKYPADIVENSYDKPVIIASNSITLESGFDSDGSEFETFIDPEGTFIPADETDNMYVYEYDDKYQLKTALYAENGNWDPTETNSRNAVRNLNYDKNGNILTLDRYDGEASLVDDFNYHYTTMNSANQPTNMLTSVDNYTNAYQYNKIGQMTASIGRDGVDDQFMTYDVTGKVTEIKDDQDNLKYTYEYDDRGFRILKRDETNDKETWYVRDASGNIIAILEKDGTSPRMLTELPIYGASKIGTSFRNTTRHKYNYEVTDHLGNVRAVVSKLKFMETATMETEYATKEEGIFENMATRHTSATNNTTFTDGQFTANKVAHLGGASTDVIGPAVSLKVSAGDKIKMDVNVRYEHSGDNNSGLATGILDVLATSFGVTSTGETAATHGGFSSALTSITAFGSTGTNIPKAYIQYLLFDNDYNYITTTNTTYKRITSAAMVTADPNQSAENLYLEVDPAQDGYIYIFVVNETAQTNVFFDDLTVAQLGVDITQTSDYYPFGSVMNHWQKEDYRFGYQGEYSEEDKETGFNHFEARAYDPAIGRWMVVDPARQHWSPYVGMGNNPANRLDPDGRTDKYTVFGEPTHPLDINPGPSSWGGYWNLDYSVMSEIGKGFVGMFKHYDAWVGGENVVEGTLTVKAGANWEADGGATGVGVDLGSYSQSWELDGDLLASRLADLNFNFETVKMTLKPKTGFEQGLKLETGAFDFKVKKEYSIGGWGIPRFKGFKVGIGIPFGEIRYDYSSQGIHNLRIGSQEDWGSGVGISETLGYFVGRKWTF